jgi:hypothetical protein
MTFDRVNNWMERHKPDIVYDIDAEEGWWIGRFVVDVDVDVDQCLLVDETWGRGATFAQALAQAMESKR